MQRKVCSSRFNIVWHNNIDLEEESNTVIVLRSKSFYNKVDGINQPQGYFPVNYHNIILLGT